MSKGGQDWCGKIRHDTYHDARRHMVKFMTGQTTRFGKKRKAKRYTRKSRLCVYRCKVCGKYHWGHMR